MQERQHHAAAPGSPLGNRQYEQRQPGDQDRDEHAPVRQLQGISGEPGAPPEPEERPAAHQGEVRQFLHGRLVCASRHFWLHLTPREPQSPAISCLLWSGCLRLSDLHAGTQARTITATSAHSPSVPSTIAITPLIDLGMSTYCCRSALRSRPCSTVPSSSDSRPMQISASPNPRGPTSIVAAGALFISSSKNL